MANPIKAQELIDIDGLRAKIAEAKTEYKDWIDSIVQLNKTAQDSLLRTRNEIEQIKKSNAGGDNGKDQEQYIQRVQGLSQQYRDQKVALDALNKTDQLHQQITESLIARQERLITEYASLEGNTAKVVATKKRLAKEMVDLQNQLEKAGKSAKVAADGAKEATGQYNALQKELTQARRDLKALDDAFDTNTGKLNRNNAAAVALANKITVADTAIKKMDAGMGQFGRNVGNYQSVLEGLATSGVSSLGLLGVVLAKIVEIGGQALSKMSQFEQIRGGLRGVTKDSQDLVHTEEQLEAIADQLGISYGVLAGAYKGIKVGTENTALEGQKAERIFRAFVARLAEIKAPAEKSEKALLALEQMISKNTVGAEELRQQLGDAMPGAFKLFADAMGVSTEKLNDMLKNGEVLAIDVLPKVADQLEKTYSGTATENVDQLTGATARLDNQTWLLLDTFNQTAGVTRFFAKIKNNIADTLAIIRLAVRDKDWNSFFEEFNILSPGKALYKVFAGTSSTALDAEKRIQAFKQMSAGMRQARLDLLREDAENAKNQYDYLGGGPEALERYKKYSEELRTLQRVNLKLLAQDQKQAQIDQRTSDQKYHEGRVAAVKKQAEELSLAERNVLIKQYQGQIQTDTAKQKTSPELTTSLQRDINYAKEFIKTIQDVNKELEKKDAKDAVRDAKAKQRASAQAARQAEAARKAALQNNLGLTSADTNTQLDTLSSRREQGLVDEQQYIMARYNITVSGINKRLALLKAAGEEETDDFAKTQRELTKAMADYQKGRDDLQEKAFRRAVDAVKNVIDADTGDIRSSLSKRIADLETAYGDEETVIKRAVSRRQISEGEGEQRLADLKIQLLKDIADANASYSALIQQNATNRLNNLEKQLRAEGNSEVDIARALQNEREQIERERNAAEKQASDDRVRINAEENQKKQKNDDEANRKRMAAIELLAQISITSVSGYTDLVNSFRDQDLARLEKQKDYELSLVGDNAEAKAAIEKEYDQKSREIKRKQAAADKAAALFSIAINTAVAASRVLTEPFLLPLTIALGAIQLAVVAAKPIPEFWKGTSDAPEGPAWVGERGYELIESKQGGKPSYRLAAEKQIMYLNAHDRVMTHQETKRFLRVNTEIAQEVRTAPGGSQYQPPVTDRSGLSKEDMRQVMLETLGSQVIEQTTLTDGELKTYLITKQQRIERKNKMFRLPLKSRGR